MPRDTLKIDRFEGGLNTKADRRDIDDNQATRIVDGYVATPGKITLSGGAVPFINELDKIKIQRAGWGLFNFMQDYDLVTDQGTVRGGVYLDYADPAWPIPNQELSGRDSLEYYLKLYDPSDQDLEVDADVDLPRLVIRENSVGYGDMDADNWTTLSGGLPLYSERDHIKEPILPKLFKHHGTFRIIDSNLKQFGMFNKWLGIVKDTKFIGPRNPNYSSTLTPDWNETSAWLYTHADCRAPRSYSNARHHVDIGVDLPRLKSTSSGTFISVHSSDGSSANIPNERGLSTIYPKIYQGGGGKLNIEDDTDLLNMQNPIYLGLADGAYETGFPDPFEIVKVVEMNNADSGSGDHSYLMVERGMLGTEPREWPVGGGSDTFIYLYAEGGYATTTHDTEHSTTSRAELDYNWGSSSLVAANNRYITYNESPGLASASDFTLNNDTVSLYDSGQTASCLPGQKASLQQNMADSRDYLARGLMDLSANGSLWPLDPMINVYSWGRSNNGTVWSGEHPGVHFVYEFQERHGTITDELEPAWFKGEKIRFYCSFIYDGKPGTFGAQESGLTDITPTNSGRALSTTCHLNCTIKVKWTGVNKNHFRNRNLAHSNSSIGSYITNEDVYDTATQLKKLYFNPRVTGCRIYYSRSESEDTNKYLLLESWFDQEGGIKKVGGTQYMPWASINYGNMSTADISHYCVSSKSDLFNQNGKQDLRMHAIRGKYEDGHNWTSGQELGIEADTADATIKHECFFFQAPPDELTYYDLNGHEGNETDMLYKCSAEVNGQRFVGNVAYPVVWDRTSQSDNFDEFFKGRTYGDRVVMAASGQPDILVEENYLSVLPNDGEEIIHMESFNDELIVFKQNTLIVISVDVADGIVDNSIKNIYKYKGITEPYHATHLEQGIAFINKYGAFLFTGDDILDITTERITLKQWNWSDNKSIGYDPIDRNIIIMDDISASAETSGWIYNLDTGGWTQLYKKFDLAGAKSNFINNKDGLLIFSAFNDQAASLTIGGMQFRKEPGFMNYLKAPGSSMTDVISAGAPFSVYGSHLSRDDVSEGGFQFHSFSMKNGTTPNVMILYGGEGSLIDKGDYLIMNANLYWDPEDVNNVVAGTGIHPWKVIDFGYNFVPQPVSLEPIDDEFISSDLLPDTGELTPIRPHRVIPFTDESDFGHPIRPFTDEGDEGVEPPDPPPVPVGWPAWFVIEKQTHIGNNGVPIDNTILGDEIGTDGDGNPLVKRILDVNLAEVPLVWRTLNTFDRKTLYNGQSITGNLFFDGIYKAQEVTDTLIKFDSDYGEARYGFNYDSGRIFNFTRFYRYIPEHDESGDMFTFDIPHETFLNSDGHGNSDIDPLETLSLSNMMMWSRSAQVSTGFDIITKDIDFDETSSNKKIYKVHITYMSPYFGDQFDYPPRVRVVGIVTTPDGVFTVYPNVAKCINYGLQYHATFYGDVGQGNKVLETFAATEGHFSLTDASVTQEDSKRATIVFNDPNGYLRNALSFQVRLLNSAKQVNPFDEVVLNTEHEEANPTSSRFEVNDISIIYRIKKVK